MTTILESKDLSIQFGGLKAVDQVNMEIKQGEVFGIIGPNGAGKTTFFNMCSGVYKPTSGEVFFEGKQIGGMPPEEIARLGLARTFQNIKLFKFMSVLENVKIGFHTGTSAGIFNAIMKDQKYKDDEEFIDRRGREILEMLNLTPFADTLAGNLSYGMQRKVEIARALALDPKLLLLDEPAAGMNPNESAELSKFIKMINEQGYTIVLIEHDMKFVMSSCDRLLVLNFGKKIAEGLPQEVRENEQVIEAYFGRGFVSKKEAEYNA